MRYKSIQKMWFHFLLRDYCRALNRLRHSYFECYLDSHYLALRHLFETQIQRAHQRLFRVTRRLRMMQDIILLERLYEMTCSLGNLRLRVSDRAVFKICEKEFLIINRLIDKILQSRTTKYILPYLDQLAVAIHELEDLWQGALRVTAPEPLVFLFFIQDLTHWHQAMTNLVKDYYA